jgi:hypothetical protein
MEPSGLIRRVALVRTDVSDEDVADIVSLIRIDELGTAFRVTSY